jgi:hypothetical protein
MLGMDAVRAGLVVLLPIVSQIWWIYLWSVLIEAAGLVFLPARDASLPTLVRAAGEDADLQLANGLVLGTSYATIPLGAGAFFGLLYFAEHVLHVSSGYGAFVLVFAVDALTYLASYVAIAGIAALRQADDQEAARVPITQTRPAGFASAFSIPLVRTILPAVITVTIGIGALFSVGITFITEVLKASSGEFVALIACFGVGAGIGLGVSRLLPAGQYIRAARLGVLVQGGVITAMSLGHHYWIAVFAAAGFGASAALTLVSGMSVLQTRLDGLERDRAFAVFHVTIRVGLGLAAVGAGAAADRLSSVNWPVLGYLPSERVVLFSAGVLVALSSLAVHERKVASTEEVRARA